MGQKWPILPWSLDVTQSLHYCPLQRPEGWSDSTGPHDAQSITEVGGRASPVWGQHIVMFSRRPPPSSSSSSSSYSSMPSTPREGWRALANEMYERWCQKQFLCLKTSHFSYILHKVMLFEIGNWMMGPKRAKLNGQWAVTHGKKWLKLSQ